jgi:hypothetical protein
MVSEGRRLIPQEYRLGNTTRIDLITIQELQDSLKETKIGKLQGQT